MKNVILLAFLLVTGCASSAYHWQPETWAKTNIDEAHNDCTLKTKAVMGKKTPSDWGYINRWNAFMKECMSGQGYTYVKD